MRNKELAIQALLKAKVQMERSRAYLENMGEYRITEDEEEEIIEVMIEVQDLINRIEQKG
jgi:hypothetical protein